MRPMRSEIAITFGFIGAGTIALAVIVFDVSKMLLVLALFGLWACWLERQRFLGAIDIDPYQRRLFSGHGVAITNLVALAMRDLILERDTDRTRLAIIGRKPVNLGPRLLRDPLVRLSSAQSLRQDDRGGSKPPFLFRLLQRLS